uniref:RRM domain-containing protein n=1 Tax=Steinernema glaseri TaxID=37863 RepID=A0A1I7YB50_9BILA
MYSPVPIYSSSGVYVPQTMYVSMRSGHNGFPYYNVQQPGFLPGMVGSSMMGNQSSYGDGPAQLRKLFIGGLNHETTDEQLRAYYSQWGNVVDCIVIRDPQTKHSRGFGFVTFATVQMAESAMSDRPHTINGKVVDPKRAIPREQMTPFIANHPPHFLEGEPQQGCKVIISGIHWDYHTVDDLRFYFEKFGNVEQVEILGHPRGYGFVVFEEKNSADRCNSFGRVHTINGRRCDVRPASQSDLLGASQPRPPSDTPKQFSDSDYPKFEQTHFHHH